MSKVIMRRTVVMPKDQSSGLFVIQNARGYKYLSFINNSPAVIEAYQEVLTQRDIGARYIYKCPSFGQYSIPIEERPDFTFFWESSSSQDESFQIMLSEENPNFNSTFLAPSQAGAVKLVQDDVGLARSKQFPSTLSSTGAMRTSLTEPLPAGTNHLGSVNVGEMPPLTDSNAKIGRVDIASPVEIKSLPDVAIYKLPPLPTGNNTIGNVSLVGSLPAGTASIGKVEISKMPTSKPDQIVDIMDMPVKENSPAIVPDAGGSIVGMYVKANPSNNQTLMVGTHGSNAFWPLSAGEWVFLPTPELYVSTKGSQQQNVSVMVVLAQ